MDNAFLREAMLLGEDALARLSRAHVAVFGIGGVGSWCAEALARGGVGALTFVDGDAAGETNLNRQLIALRTTLGRNKAELMAERALAINPACRVTALPFFYEEDAKERFFTGARYDYIVDAIDLVSCKLSLILTARAQNVPIVSAMGTGNKLDPFRLRIADISETSGCPLARVVRKELRKRGVTRHTVLYSAEPPRKPAQPESPPPGRRSIPGSVSWVPSCAGLMLAGYVIQALISGTRPPCPAAAEG